MKDMSLISRAGICMLLCVAVVALNNIFLLLSVNKPYTYVEVEKVEDTTEKFEADSIVLETAAHIPAESFAYYTKVWEDKETDRAVYIKDDYKPSTVINSGETAVFSGVSCTIIDTDEQGFTIELPGSGIAQKGMSGSIVYYHDTPVGFISKAKSPSRIYVVLF